jgi:hypothetical protein
MQRARKGIAVRDDPDDGGKSLDRFLIRSTEIGAELFDDRHGTEENSVSHAFRLVRRWGIA